MNDEGSEEAKSESLVEFTNKFNLHKYKNIKKAILQRLRLYAFNYEYIRLIFYGFIV